MLHERLTNLMEKTRQDVAKRQGGSLEEQVMEQYIDSLSRYPKICPYSYVSPEVKSICSYIEKQYGEPGLEAFHKHLLLRLIAHNLGKIQESDVPGDVISIYEMNFFRLIDEIQKNVYKGPYLYSNDKFCKDIALCSMRLIPVGARKINISYLSTRFLFKGGVIQFWKGLACILFQLKGTKPVFKMHTDSKDPDLLKEFHEEGWKKSYVRIAELLKADRKIKGLCAVSWFYDPQVQNISPRLAYIRKIVVENGGKTFYVGSNRKAIMNATKKSMTRRTLYEQGEYLPTNYQLIWPRDKLIKWSENIPEKVRFRS